VKLAIATALLALVAAAPATAGAGAGEPASASLAGYHYCGKIPNPDTGGTTRIYGHRVGCRDSKSLWRLWRRNLDKQAPTCNNKAHNCEVTHVHHFRCVYGGTDLEIRLRCTRGTQRMRAYWGG
jgi:hypothetical protein